MTHEETIANLKLLAEDLSSEGYAGGVSGAHADQWLNAWAVAMLRVAKGEPYTENLVATIFNDS